MKLDIKIKKLGKLSEADIQIRNFTVFAGPNNTGKTYVSKTLYSMLDAMKAEHIGEALKTDVSGAEKIFDHLMKKLPEAMEGKKNFTGKVKRRLKKMEALFDIDQEKSFDEKVGKINATLEARKKLASQIISLSEDFGKQLPERKDKSELSSTSWGLWERYSGNQLRALASEDPESLINRGLSFQFERNLASNFSIGAGSLLRRHRKKTATVACEEMGEFSIGSVGGKVKSSLEKIRKFQKNPKLVYLESPDYWKIPEVLDVCYPETEHPYEVSPRHFYDLVSALREKENEDHRHSRDNHGPHGNAPDVTAQKTRASNENPKQTSSFHKLHEAIAETIGGKLTISGRNSLSFQENGTDIPLRVSGTGVITFGMLGLLIEKGIIDENTFLFMDEPEAHLHPAWQVEMAETLYKLAQLGVHVIISTHSVDILKWIEVQVKNNPGSEKNIALNHFSTQGKTIAHDGDFMTKLSAIQAELTEPHFNLYIRDL